MTKTSRGAALLILVAACGADTKVPAVRAAVASASVAPSSSSVAPTASALPPPAPKLTLAELIDRSLAQAEAAWMAHDAQKLAATYAAGVEVRATLPTEPWSPLGKAALEAQLAQLLAAFPDARLTTTRTLRTGNVVAAEGYFTGSSAGKKVGCPVLALSWFDESGLVKQQHVVFDPATVLGQLGKGDRKAKVRAVDPIPTAPIVVVTAGGTPSEAKNVELVRAYYASAPKTKSSSVGELWGAGSFVVAEIGTSGGVRGADVFELREGQVRLLTSYGPAR